MLTVYDIQKLAEQRQHELARSQQLEWRPQEAAAGARRRRRARRALGAALLWLAAALIGRDELACALNDRRSLEGTQ